jgi:hypothetical protein
VDPTQPAPPPSRHLRCRCTGGLRIRERGDMLILSTYDETELVIRGAVLLARCGMCGGTLRNVATRDEPSGPRR